MTRSWPIICVGVTSLLLITATSHAHPPEGFHEGPYLQFVTGARRAAFDFNRVTNASQAHAQEALFGFHFGWNFTDAWAWELSGHYSSPGTETGQEHLVGVQMHGRYSFITDPLTDFASLRILPYVSVGPVVQFNLLPTDTGVDPARVRQWAVGLGGGGGVSFLFLHDAVYLSLGGQADLVHRDAARQILSGVDTTIYTGGWGLDWQALAALGVHF